MSNPMYGEGQRRRRDPCVCAAVTADVTARRHCRLRSSPPCVRRCILVSETGSRRHGHARGRGTNTHAHSDWLSGQRPAGKQSLCLIDGCKSTVSNKSMRILCNSMQLKVIACLYFQSNLLSLDAKQSTVSFIITTNLQKSAHNHSSSRRFFPNGDP